MSLAFAPNGQPAIAYLAANLKYATFNGTSWDVVTVDTAGGHYASLAFTPSGQPAISYQHQQAGDLRYAVFDGANWQVTTVDSTGVVGEHTSLAFGPNGQPSISYYDGTNVQLK